RAGPAIATRCREPGAAALPPAIDDAIAWMMRKDPAERPPNLQSAMRALEEAAGVEFVSDVPLSRRTPSALTPMPPRRASTEPPRRNSDTAFAHTIDVAPSISAPAPRRSRWWIAGVLGVLVVTRDDAPIDVAVLGAPIYVDPGE